MSWAQEGAEALLRPAPAASGKAKAQAQSGKIIRFDELKTFVEHDGEFDEFLGERVKEPEGKVKAPIDRNMIPEGDMLVETSDSDSEDDMHSKDQIGKIPSHWYDEEDHIGYDLDGKQVKKGKQKDRLDQFLAKMDDPDYGRTIIDPITKKEIRLTDEEIDMIKRIQGGQFPDSNMDPYEDYVDWFSNTKMVMPLSVRAFAAAGPPTCIHKALTCPAPAPPLHPLCPLTWPCFQLEDRSMIYRTMHHAYGV